MLCACVYGRVRVCVCVCQVVGMTVLTLFFAAAGFLSPANRGSLMIALLLLFLFMGSFGGYEAARTHKVSSLVV